MMAANKFFVRNLPWSFCEESLRSLFSRYGHVKKAVVVFDKNNGLSKQYGFVEMNTVEEVEKILATKSFYIANGKIEVGVATNERYEHYKNKFDYTKP